MRKRHTGRSHLGAMTMALALVVGAGCAPADDSVGSSSDNITDVQHTDVEDQAIGNCWIYATSSWIESLHLSRTGNHFDASQSYITYWDWYVKIVQGAEGDEIETGGDYATADRLLLDYGVMAEGDFVAEDTVAESSARQSEALSAINAELSEGGRLHSAEARGNSALVRQVLDDAWQLDAGVRAQLEAVFGDGSAPLSLNPAAAEGTKIIPAQAFEVRYTDRSSFEAKQVDTTLDQAISDWVLEYYPSILTIPTDQGYTQEEIDDFVRWHQTRLQLALHDRQPVVIDWLVDFNAMESEAGPMQGSFTLSRLQEKGKGSQGGHMTVLEDYQVMTEEYGLLEAGVTLDPNKPDDAAKLDAALLDSSEVQFFRIKNSWGTLRPDESVQALPGYHDLYMDYINGPFEYCQANPDTGEDDCFDAAALLGTRLPPGY
jgi:hypothetical protein